MGFGDTLAAIKAALEADVDLQALASSSWGKPVTVKITWRNREEISGSDLPLIMITRPASTREYGTNQQRLDRSSVRIYAGFYQPKEDLRQSQLIDFEEAILDAIERDEQLVRFFDWAKPVETANDEGALGETCFCVIQAGMTRRSKA